LVLSQHFLLSAAARTLSLKAVLRMTDEEAHSKFMAIRWAANDGKPYCPFCGCLTIYTLSETPPRWKCKACRRKFSVTSQTIFASRKLPIREYLAAILLYVNGVKGVSSLQLSRDLGINAKSAFVMLHKLREAIEAEQSGAALTGTCEIDGAYFGGKIRQENRAEDRADRRLAEEQTGKRQVVVVVRERGGRTITSVCRRESEGVTLVRARVPMGATIHADEARGWDTLHAHYDMRRVNHSAEFMSENGACTNQAESYFSRLRRCEFGIHHRISGRLLARYAAEIAWREDHRRVSNGEQWSMIAGLALAHPKSEWAGYWHRSAA
jgi:transposase-like protein